MTSLAPALQREYPRGHIQRVPARMYPQPPPSLAHRPDFFPQRRNRNYSTKSARRFACGITVCERKTLHPLDQTLYLLPSTNATRVRWARKKSSSFSPHLAMDKHVSAATQNQALNALVFLYRHVLDLNPGWLDNHRPRQTPTTSSDRAHQSRKCKACSVRWTACSGSSPICCTAPDCV